MHRDSLKKEMNGQDYIPKDMQVIYRSEAEQGFFASCLSALGLADTH